MQIFNVFKPEQLTHSSEESLLDHTHWNKFRGYFLSLKPALLEQAKNMFSAYGQADSIRRAKKIERLTEAAKLNIELQAREEQQHSAIKAVHDALRQVLQLEILRKEEDLKNIAINLEQTEVWHKSKFATHWKGAIKFSCANAKDILQEIQVLEAINTYAEVAIQEIKYQRFNLFSYLRPKPVKIIQQQYYNYLTALNQQVIEEKQAICLAILHLLQAHARSDNWQRDDSINELLLPLLNTVNISYFYKRKQLSESLTAKQFSQLIDYALTHGSPAIKQEIKALLAKPLTELSYLTPFDIANYGLLPTPRPFAKIISLWRPWYKRIAIRLLLGKDYLNRLFTIESYAQIVMAGKILNKLKAFMAKDQFPADLGAYNHCIKELDTARRLLTAEGQRLNNLLPKNESWRAKIIKSLLLGLNEWNIQLKGFENELNTLQVQIATGIAESLAKQFSRGAAITPEILANIRSFFDSAKVESFDSALQSVYQKTYKLYLQATNYAAGFIEELSEGAISNLILIEEGEWFISKPQTLIVESLLEYYRYPLVSKSQEAVIQATLLLIQGYAYPKDITQFKLGLLQLFRSAGAPELARDKFYNLLLKQYVVPAQISIDSPAYQFLQAADNTLASDWIREQRRKSAFAKQGLIKLLDTFPGKEYDLQEGSSQEFIVDGQTIKPDLRLMLCWIDDLKRLSNTGKKSDDSLSRAITSYLESYCGSNPMYNRLFTELAKLKSDPSTISQYGQKRFTYLFERSMYETLLDEDWLSLQALENEDFSERIQVYLQDYIKQDKAWSQSVEEIIFRFGTPEQFQTYQQKLDDERLSYIKKLIAEDTYSVPAVQAFIAKLQNSCIRGYPYTEAGKQKFQLIFIELNDMSWNEKAYILAQAFGNENLQRAALEQHNKYRSKQSFLAAVDGEVQRIMCFMQEAEASDNVQQSCSKVIEMVIYHLQNLDEPQSDGSFHKQVLDNLLVDLKPFIQQLFFTNTQHASSWFNHFILPLPLGNFRSQVEQCYHSVFEAHLEASKLNKELTDATANSHYLNFIHFDLRRVYILNKHAPMRAKKRLSRLLLELIDKLAVNHPIRPVVHAFQLLLLGKLAAFHNKAHMKRTLQCYQPTEPPSHTELQQAFFAEIEVLSQHLGEMDSHRLIELKAYYNTRLLIQRVTPSESIHAFIQQVEALSQGLAKQLIERLANFDNHLEIDNKSFNAQLIHFTNGLTFLEAWQCFAARDELLAKIQLYAAKLANVLLLKLSKLVQKRLEGHIITDRDYQFVHNSRLFINQFSNEPDNLSEINKAYDELIHYHPSFANTTTAITRFNR